MRARRQGTNNPYTRIEKIQLENSDILYSSDVMEFDVQPDDFPSKEEILDESYWQEVRNQAAIAAMQGTMSILGSSDRGAFRDIVVEGYRGKERTYPKEIAEFAVACADALIDQLKKK
jgi:hypothetical protein